MAKVWAGSRKSLPLNMPERQLFPLHWASDRLGNEFPPIRGSPNCGPGHYDTFSVCSALTHSLQESISPGPAVYQKRFGRGHVFKPSSAPFGSTSQRNNESSSKLQVPGPGTYDLNIPRNRHVTWPMKFDAPDWSLVAAPKKRTLRIELAGDKEFRKHRNRVAYFSLYYT